MKDTEELYEAYARYILEESSTPIDEIIWLVNHLQSTDRVELEETIKTFIP